MHFLILSKIRIYHDMRKSTFALFQNSETVFATAPASPSQSMAGGLTNSATPNLSLEPDPILCGKLAGRHELRIKIKQGEGVAGPKVSELFRKYWDCAVIVISTWIYI